MNTAVFMLRCLQVGLTLSDLDNIDYGQVMDMVIESGNDGCEYKQVATQEDFDRF
jgi:hypothetical protein